MCTRKCELERGERKKKGEKRGWTETSKVAGGRNNTYKCTDAIPLLKHLTCDPKTTLIVQVPKTIAQSTCIQNIHDASGKSRRRKEGEEGNPWKAELF